MDEEKLNKPTSRKSSSSENGKGKDIVDSGDGEEVTLKAKMSLLNGITVIVGSIIGKFNFMPLKTVTILKLVLGSGIFVSPTGKKI